MQPTSVYQPIVELESGEVVAYEALARGPGGEPPMDLFAAARAGGTLAELDWACRLAAVRGARAAGMGSHVALFVNIEPEVAGTPAPSAAIAEEIQRARKELSIFLEVTERALTHRPAELLGLLEGLRDQGVGIALDDVGADPRSLALLPVLRPDVVKLDMSLVRDATSRESAAVMTAVCAHAEATGAVILAEGVETEEHLLVARTLGARFGQGWFFGRPEPLPASMRTRGSANVRITLPGRVATESPVALVGARVPLRAGRKDILIGVSHHLEAQARRLGEEAVVVSAFQDARFFTPDTCRRYAELAEGAALVAALGVDLAAEPAPGVRGAPITADDPLGCEWDVAVLGPHFAAALVARDVGDDGPDRLRRFDFALTFDRELVVDVVQALLGRVVARRV